MSTEISLKLPLPEGKPTTVTLASEHALLAPSSEAIVAATLLPAMKTGTDVGLDRALDPTFRDNLSAIQDIYATWYDAAERIAVNAPSGFSSAPTADRTATFFTGGVDSFYTLIKHEEKIDALVYVHGFDVNLEDTALRAQVSTMLHAVGAHFGKEVIEVETDLRDFSEKRAGWDEYHGAALATVGHALTAGFDTFLIPSTHTYADLFPWGSHPLLDPLWATGGLRFIHDGCEASRVQKCERLAALPTVLEHLRVCFRNPEGTYNCGRCEKCMRTMVNLAAVGAPEDCPTFDVPLDLSCLRNVQIRDENIRAFVSENLSFLRRHGHHPELEEALSDALRSPTLPERIYRSVRHRIRRLPQRLGLHR